METINTIHARKSTRAFSDKRVDNKVLCEILLAGIQAPSPKNDQPWFFLVVEQREKRYEAAEILEARLREIKRKNDLLGIERSDIMNAFESVRVLKEAPVLVFVYLDPEKSKGHDDDVTWELSARDSECTHIMSIGAAIQNILLAATEKGVDSLWLGDIFYAYNRLHEYLGVEGCIMAAVVLGYSAENGEKTSRKMLDKSVYWL